MDVGGLNPNEFQCSCSNNFQYLTFSVGAPSQFNDTTFVHG
uniref:Uncharacterized protein n=1 Tax=Arundo donax TaxID=35708 RepID=A0A0A8ZN05_ARUDO